MHAKIILNAAYKTKAHRWNNKNSVIHNKTTKITNLPKITMKSRRRLNARL